MKDFKYTLISDFMKTFEATFHIRKIPYVLFQAAPFLEDEMHWGGSSLSCL